MKPQAANTHTSQHHTKRQTRMITNTSNITGTNNKELVTDGVAGYDSCGWSMFLGGHLAEALRLLLFQTQQVRRAHGLSQNLGHEFHELAVPDLSTGRRRGSSMSLCGYTHRKMGGGGGALMAVHAVVDH